jgi:TrmH family RNA methyltransferase
VRSPWQIERLLITPAGRERHCELLSQITAEVVEIPARAFESLSGTEVSQEIMALVKPRAVSWADCLSGPGITVVLDCIQDPGNAGTIVRSAEAFGASGVIFLEGSVRVANGKFLRAAAGSLFRLPYLENQNRSTLMTNLRFSNRALYALLADAAHSLDKTDLRKPCAIVVGSEAHGVSAELRACATGVRIPTMQVESLNAGVACSIVLFEAVRQRGMI